MIKPVTTTDEGVIKSIETNKKAASDLLTRISNGENPFPSAFHLAIDLGTHFTEQELDGALQLYELNSKDKIGAKINIQSTRDYIHLATRRYVV